MQEIIDGYYKSIESLEQQMRAKRDEVRLKAFESAEFDDGEAKRERLLKQQAEWELKQKI